MIHPCHAAGLSLWDQVSCYCERGLDPGFWAEPLNALSNVFFLVAAVMAYADLRAARVQKGGGVILALILLVMVVGSGSFLFHTFATAWARLADAGPIALFVFAYLLLALCWFLGLGAIPSAAIAVAVAAVSRAMPPWFNGSFAYAPPLLAMLALAVLLKARDHPAANWIAAAAGVFTLSLVLRTVDAGAGCLLHPPFRIGTHVFWHILNATTLYLLLRAAIDNAPGRR